MPSASYPQMACSWATVPCSTNLSSMPSDRTCDVRPLSLKNLATASPTPAQDAVLDRKDTVETCGFAQQRLVQRLGKAQVIVRYGDWISALDSFDGLGGEIACRADGYDGHVLAILQASALARGYGLERHAAPLDTFAAAARVAYGVWRGGIDGRVEHVAQFEFVHRRRHYNIRYAREVGQIETTVMCGSVLTHNGRCIASREGVAAQRRG